MTDDTGMSGGDGAKGLALITGASAGIGAACARRLAADGYDLSIWARRDTALLELAAEIIGTTGRAVDIRVVDVRDRASVEAAAGDMIAGDLVPDVLVNNAGLAAGLATVQEGDPDDWDRMIDTNVKGLLWVTRAVLPAMIERDRGHIVNIGSISGRHVYRKGNVYNATKFAVRALNEAMALDLTGTQIRVTTVNPGAAETEFALVRFEGDAERAESIYDGFVPLTGDDVADAVSWVVSRPPQVNISILEILPTAQRSGHVIHREDTG